LREQTSPEKRTKLHETFSKDCEDKGLAVDLPRNLLNLQFMVYRFKIWFENQDDVIRWIDIKPSQTFKQLHDAIQNAIGFDGKELASFHISDSRWKRLFEIMLEDMTEGESEMPTITMEMARLRDYINDPHQRFIYVTDYLANWTLLCEMQSIEDPKADATYPLLVKSEGKSPRQREDSKFKMLDDSEFDVIAAKILASKGIQNELTAEFNSLEQEGVDSDEDDDEFSDDEESDDDEFNFKDVE
jgi:hypothetical protein